MTLSPMFADEMAVQVQVARQELLVAEHECDEDRARTAAARLAELEELYARATDTALRTVPGLW